MWLAHATADPAYRAIGVLIFVFGAFVLADSIPARSRRLAGIYRAIAFAVSIVAVLSSAQEAAPGIIVDARATIIAFASIFGGPYAGLATTLAGIAYRWHLGGAGAGPGVLGLGLTYLACLLAMRLPAVRRAPRSVPAIGLVTLAAAIGDLPAQIIEPSQPGVLFGFSPDMFVHTAPVEFAYTLGTAVILAVFFLLREHSAVLEQEVRQEHQGREDAQRASSRLLQSLTDSPLAGFATLTGGQISYANARFAEIFACTPADLTGGNFDWLAPPERATLHEVERRLAAGETPAPFRLATFRRDGTDMVVECTVSPMPGNAHPGDPAAVMLMLQDVTERAHFERTLIASEQRFRAAFENAAVGMVEVDIDQRLLISNDNFCRFLGYSADELHLKEVAAITHPDDRDVTPGLMDQLRSGAQQTSTADKRYITKTGSIVWGHVSISPRRDATGNLIGYLGIVADITAQREAEAEVKARLRQIEDTLEATLQAVSKMVDMRDPYTAGHERRVGRIAAAIAREMGMNTLQCHQMELTGLVHDVGQIAVPAEILNFPGKLGPTEMAIVHTHAEQGYQILKEVPFPWPVAEIIHQHHERMDGSGYPRGLKGDAILPEARILAVADVLEAMVAYRTYRPGQSLDVALAEIANGRGTLFDAAVVDATLHLIRDKGYELPH